MQGKKFAVSDYTTAEDNRTVSFIAKDVGTIS